ncbi:putative unusual protein kinase regulating ubiquinone biosynthesis (AarF/ABC1/UbiB family) [Lysobacter niastensis]|uniref:Unusual protein kinase regulating ubiquinone biosynthesis (AarF/ABC1/UbiB family) n=1 Tax=Lysobacter niastensis TaxID=380629 RepID=A0ABU1WD03_9GAMM|nr:AarF/UbiB family protein [Lysobacter niastensis]MDR7135508.1 putative unusual protein kinase regulating ubiquinone biosynthesis (AarF/ABC1/UbiB family) [Lysobacter niastensis]
MNPTGQQLARTSRILRFLVKYRHSGMFTGWDLRVPLDVAIETVDHRPDQFVDDLEALGPTFVKLGQALSTRPDLVPPAYLTALTRMQSQVTQTPWPEIRAQLESALGESVEARFASFDTVPLGSASLAQVHRARLHDGRVVAVKIQRPGIAEEVSHDLATLESIASGVDHTTGLGQRVRFTDWVHEFRRALIAELDYCLEAANLERFSDHLAEYPDLLVPRPVWELTRSRVLVMELITGVQPEASVRERLPKYLLERLCESLLRGYVDQMFIHGEIHADPHPGNMLITADGRMGIFDLGMVVHVPPRQRLRLLKLMFSAIDGRGDDAVEEVIALGTRLEDFDEERYLREAGQMIARYAAHADVQGYSEGRLMLDLTRIGAACGLRSPPELSLLGRALLHLEGVCHLLAPELRVRPVLEDHFPRVVRAQMQRSMSLPSLAVEAVELQALIQDAPRKVSAALSLLAENRLQVRVTGLQESRLMENLQKIANRIAAGVVIAALILASALLLRAQPGGLMSGYSKLAMLLFVIATALGLGLVISALFHDRKAKPPEERGPRG